ncbi:MAG: hypothetical protein KF874_03920 [Rhizobiaceae bacterium]|nr:hypothetical protein [Rhizobiaceae bacterium]
MSRPAARTFQLRQKVSYTTSHEHYAASRGSTQPGSSCIKQATFQAADHGPTSKQRATSDLRLGSGRQITPKCGRREHDLHCQNLPFPRDNVDDIGWVVNGRFRSMDPILK